MKCDSKTYDPRHAITIVGYGREDKYYVCQNSYDVEWGHKGYFRILRHLIGEHYNSVGVL